MKRVKRKEVESYVSKQLNPMSASLVIGASEGCMMARRDRFWSCPDDADTWR